MHLSSLVRLTLAGALACVAGCANTEPQQPEAAPAVVAEPESVSFDIAFITHLDADMPEQDVYIERVPGSSEVYRVTKGDQRHERPRLYKTAVRDPPRPVRPPRRRPAPEG